MKCCVLSAVRAHCPPVQDEETGVRRLVVPAGSGHIARQTITGGIKARLGHSGGIKARLGRGNKLIPFTLFHHESVPIVSIFEF